MDIRLTRKVLIICFTWMIWYCLQRNHKLGGLLQTVKNRYEVGLEKCAKVTFLKWRLEKLTLIELDKNKNIKELEQEEIYKFLGVNETNGIQHTTMKEEIRKECYITVWDIFETEPNSANQIQAINILAIPVVTYSFNIVNWNLSDIKKINTKICELLMCNKINLCMVDSQNKVNKLMLIMQTPITGFVLCLWKLK